MDGEWQAEPRMRLLDMLAPMLDEMQRLEQHVRSMCADPGLTDEEIAEVYWLEERVPVTYFGPPHEVLQMAQQHPMWSWRCEVCGEEQFVTSRADKKRRESPPPADWQAPRWQCPSCFWREEDRQSKKWEAQRAELLESVKTREEREAELRTMPYREYLQTEEWQERRRGALKRAGYRCQVCNRERQLHVHHRTYERRGAELARDLIVLCDECHALYHRKGRLASAD